MPFCLPVALAAQQPLQYTRLTAENGLSNNSVQCILQDRNGIVWIGTNGGLNRYDGNSFLQYSVLGTPALTNSMVTSLMQDEKGYLWVGTENGLNILNPKANTLQQYIHQDAVPGSFPAGAIRIIQKLKDGSTWVASDRWMVKFNDRHTFTTVALDSSLARTDMVFTALAEHQSGGIWLSYLDQVTRLVKRTTVNGKEQLRDAQFLATDYSKIFADNKEGIWGLSCYGISRFNQTARVFDVWINNPFAPTTPNLHLHNCYSVDADGNVWQGNERSSLVKYDIRHKQVTDYNWLLSTINATSVFCIYKDNNNNTWIGTDNGIIRISNRTSVFSNIPFALKGTELKNIRCRRIIADKYNRLYAATENYGFLKMVRTPLGKDSTIGLSTFGALPISDLPFKNSSTLSIRLDGSNDIGYMYDMWYDGNNYIWLAGFGIARYDIRNDSIQFFLAQGEARVRYESINQLALCFDGNLFWTAGMHNLHTFDPGTQTMQPFKDNKGEMPFYNLPCWSLVKKGNYIWAGTNKGLYKVNITTRAVNKLPVHPVLESGINDICLDADSSFWISTAGGGIVHYNEQTGEAKQYTNKNGLTNNTVCGLLRDGNNNLWISTYAGLSYFDRRNNQFTNFYAKDGLNTDEFNRKAFTKLADGRMIFGGLNGYTLFNPADAFRNDKPVNIMLTRFSKTTGSGQHEEDIFDLNSLQEVVIEPDDKFFAFHFTLSDLYDPPSNRYMYMLQGLDNAWHAIGNQPIVSFNGLPAGKYLLKIKGNPVKGAASVNELAINLIVKQVFYKTAWFILLMFALAIAIVYIIIRYRFYQVRKIQYLRTRIASDLHDEVGSSLVHITLLSDMVKKAVNKQEMDDQLTHIAGISRGAVSTMKDMIWSIDARYDTMAGMISHMHDHVHSVLAPAEIEFGFTQQGLQEQEKLPIDFRQNVYLIFKEAINNVVKHAGASHVQIILQKENGFFMMMISDNGKGMPPAKRSSGQGLSNMQMRAGRLGAALEICSKNGVTVVLKAPM